MDFDTRLHPCLYLFTSSSPSSSSDPSCSFFYPYPIIGQLAILLIVLVGRLCRSDIVVGTKVEATAIA